MGEDGEEENDEDESSQQEATIGQTSRPKGWRKQKRASGVDKSCL